MTTKSKRQCACLYIYIKQKKLKGFRKKNQTICKKQDTLRFLIFHEFFENVVYIKKHDNLRYVTFLYTKIQTLCKKQDNLRYVLYTKLPTLRVTHGFSESLKLVEGGGT